MISKRHCKLIAELWVADEGLAEFNRRMDDVAASQRKYGLPFDEKLVKTATEGLCSGFYDPPMPRIPNFLARLFVSDWAPPERSDRMYTGQSSKRQDAM